MTEYLEGLHSSPYAVDWRAWSQIKIGTESSHEQQGEFVHGNRKKKKKKSGISYKCMDTAVSGFIEQVGRIQ